MLAIANTGKIISSRNYGITSKTELFGPRHLLIYFHFLTKKLNLNLKRQLCIKTHQH